MANSEPGSGGDMSNTRTRAVRDAEGRVRLTGQKSFAAVDCTPRNSHWARATLSDCALSLDAASGFLDAVAREEATPCTPAYAERCRRAKSFAARTAVEVSSRCMMIAGGRAYRTDHVLARALLDAAAGPLLRPPLPQAMDALAAQLLD